MRIFGLVAITMVGLLVGGGAWICNAIYGANLYVDPDCHAMPLYSRDSAKLLVADNPLAHRIDPAVYAGVVSVTFPARDGKVAVAGLLSPPPSGAPLVIATHGFTGCKHHKHLVTVLGILASAGYGVLAIDLREHGESTVLDGVAAMGSDEFSDVLGAFDYARTELGLNRSQIGFWGESMGGATTLIANTHEDLGPLFLDAPYADIRTVLKDNVAAISCGIYQGTPVLDLDYDEDSTAETDANFVMTGSGGIVEIQGTAEQEPFSEEELKQLMELAKSGISQLVSLQNMAIM